MGGARGLHISRDENVPRFQVGTLVLVGMLAGVLGSLTASATGVAVG
jgi:hypothetical protein